MDMIKIINGKKQLITVTFSQQAMYITACNAIQVIILRKYTKNIKKNEKK
ncbi:MAG: hypothetical protein ACW980_09455 [Promethearchaeota archaeon]|jgi:hypothetical protein